MKNKSKNVSIVPIENPISAKSKKRIPKKSIAGGYYMSSTSKYHS